LAKKKKFRYRYILILLILVIIGLFYGRSKVVLKTISIKGTGRNKEILSHLSFAKGAKIFGVDEVKIKKELFTIPWIRDVKIHKFLTGALVIIVRERRPIAYFIGNKPIGIEKDGSNFPLDSVPSKMPELVGGSFTPDGLGWAISFIDALSNKEFCKKIYTRLTGPITYYKDFKIIWGKGNYKEKERYIQEILKLGLKKGILDLRFNGQVVYKKEVKNG